jgi:glycosyltransferase involved in cell wall biosynthesis
MTVTKPRILALFGTRVVFGAERENIEVLAALREKGCDVLCLVRHEAWNDHIPAALAARGLAWRKVPFIDGWLRGWRLRAMLRNPVLFIVGNWRLVRIIKEFRPTHFHTFNAFYLLSFLPVLFVARTPLVYRSVDLPTQHRWIWRLLWRFVVARASKFVALSRFIARELETSGVPAERIEVIYGRPPNRLESESPLAPSMSAGAKRDIVFVGQILENKGPHLLIQAFRTLAESYSEARLLIVGRISDWRGDDWARDLRDKVANDPVLSSRVMFTGFVENVPALLRGREVLVAPTLTEEPLGLVVMEAKAAAIPSIVFPSGGLPEMIEHGVDGFVCCNKSVEALANALKLYLKDSSLAARQGAAALRSLERFGVREFADRWFAVYETAIL